MKNSNRSKIDDVKVLTLDKYIDERGYVVGVYDRVDMSEFINSDCILNHGYETLSKRDVLRGIHYQVNKPQNRLLRVVYGAIYDVVLDLRRSSPTFGKWQAEFLTAENTGCMWIPAGLAHAYLVISEFAIINIQSDHKYDSQDQRVISWNDKDLAIDWPLYANYPIMVPPVLSERDENGSNFVEAEFYD